MPNDPRVNESRKEIRRQQGSVEHIGSARGGDEDQPGTTPVEVPQQQPSTPVEQPPEKMKRA